LNRTEFRVLGVDCVSCSPYLQKELRKIHGVLEVKTMALTDRVVVVYDETELRQENLGREIEKVGRKLGLRIVFLSGI
jgi:cation transport ATPase